VFRTDNNNNIVYVTRFKEEKYSRQCVQTTVKHGLQVHVWGVISHNGVGPLKLVRGNLSAVRYQEDVISDIDEVGHRLLGEGRSPIFQHDKAPAHWAQSTRAFLAERNVKTLDWPGNSPDLNIIENVWSVVARLVRGIRASNAAELYAAIEAAWNSVSLGYIRSLYKSMPWRAAEVQKRRGSSTHY
jgi:transposase